MAMSAGREDGEPMMEMNTTPLIDVMLVLLIMFIITIPIQTHAVKVDLPQNSKNQPNPVDAQKNKITIDAAGTAQTSLRSYFAVVASRVARSTVASPRVIVGIGFM